jgi:hypothetical protein
LNNSESKEQGVLVILKCLKEPAVFMKEPAVLLFKLNYP